LRLLVEAPNNRTLVIVGIAGSVMPCIIRFCIAAPAPVRALSTADAESAALQNMTRNGHVKKEPVLPVSVDGPAGELRHAVINYEALYARRFWRSGQVPDHRRGRPYLVRKAVQLILNQRCVVSQLE
jgi:hypothetical protein